MWSSIYRNSNETCRERVGKAISEEEPDRFHTVVIKLSSQKAIQSEAAAEGSTQEVGITALKGTRVREEETYQDGGGSSNTPEKREQACNKSRLSGDVADIDMGREEDDHPREK